MGQVISLNEPLTYLHIVVAVAVLTLPGTALYLAVRRVARSGGNWSPDITLPVGVGLSIALWPLLLLYATLVRLPFFPWVVWAALPLSGAYVIYDLWYRRNASKSDRPDDTLGDRSPRSRYAAAAVGLLTFIALGLRIADAQGLEVPLFGDSLHHTMITSLILGNGMLPESYQPYVPVETFTYHFGFHTLGAVFAYLTGTAAPYAVLLLGQVMIALTVPLAYLLNTELFRSRLVGLFAALLTGFVSLMPAFYVNWGRYTQLAGQLLLLVALVFLVRLAREGSRRDDFVLLAVCVGGLVVVHYRILIFFGLFALPLGAWILARKGGRWQSALQRWAAIAGAALSGLVIAIPWIINLVVNYLPGLGARLGTVTEDYLAEYNNLEALFLYAGRVMPGVALVGLIVAVLLLLRSIRHGESGAERETPALGLVIAAWVLLLVASLYIRPGAIGSYTVAIMLFIPFSALGGYGLGTLTELLTGRRPTARIVAVAGAVVAAPLVALLFGTARVADEGGYNYVQGADLRAFDWIKSNIPPNSKFLISSEFSYTGRAVTASDAGMWLPLFTGHEVSVPALNSWMERPVVSDFFTRTRELAAYTQPLTTTAAMSNPSSNQSFLVEREIIATPHSLTDPVTLALMRNLGVTHIYVGSQEGKSEMRLNLEAIKQDSQQFEQLYNEGGIFIFRLK
jgi:hypothetical protein